MTKPLVVLLHGLARGAGSMDSLGTFLDEHGFETFGRTYPSRQHTLTELAAQVTEWIVETAGDRPISAVTHSMGGVLARHLHDPRIRWDKLVMLAPPNNGSQLASMLSGAALFRWFYGPAGGELASESGKWPAPPTDRVAIIAGTRARALTNITSWTAGRKFGPDTPNDGTVAVDETRLAGPHAFAEVDATHTWIMNDPQARELVVDFLRNGRFSSRN